MPPRRDRAYTYLVSFGATVVGNFSEVSGLDSGLSITLRRGAASAVLVGWLKAAHDGGADPRSDHDHAGRCRSTVGQELGVERRAAEEIRGGHAQRHRERDRDGRDSVDM